MPRLSIEYQSNQNQYIGATSNDLLIQISEHMLTYAILSSTGKFILLREYVKNEEDDFTSFHLKILETEPNLSGSYRNTVVGIANKRLALVPASLYDANRTKKYLEDIVPIWQTDELLTDHLRHQEIMLVYAYRQKLIQTFHQSFQDPKIINLFSAYIDEVSTLVGQVPNEQVVFVNILEKSLYIVYFSAGKLTFANVYEYNSREDILYYIMLIFKKFDLEAMTTPTYLSGKVDVQSKMHDLLYSYIAELRLVTTLNSGFIEIEDIPTHLYFDLFALVQ